MMNRLLSWFMVGAMLVFMQGCRPSTRAPAVKSAIPPLTLGAWVKLQPLPMSMAIHGSVAHRNYLYVLGGSRGAVVFYSKWNPDGTLGSWQRGRSLPDQAACNYMQAVVHGNRLYTVGGAAKAPENYGSVFFAEIQADGALGPWQKTMPLPNRLQSGAAAAAGSRLYYAGGWYQRRVYSAPIAANGAVGDWIEMPHFISPRQGHKLFVINNFIYGPGGMSGHTPDTVKDTVFRSQIQADGKLTPWKRDTSLPVPVGSYAGVVTGNTIFVFSGVSFEGRSSLAWCAAAGPDGMLGEWSALPPLPRAIELGAAAAAENGWVYLSGGFITRDDGSRDDSKEVYGAPLIRRTNRNP